MTGTGNGITTVAAPPARGAPANYVGRRPPLAPAPLVKLPLGSVRADGWLARQLELMVDGMVGRLPELSDFLKDDSGWLGGDERGWEEAAYWLRGFHDLAVLTGDERCGAEAGRWIEAVIASQDDDGYFGSRYNKRIVGKGGRAVVDLWPHMVVIDALIHHHEATGDERVVTLLSCFFEFCSRVPDDEFLPTMCWEEWERYNELFGDWKPRIQLKRAGDMVPHVFWLYDRTGDERLLDLAVRFHQRIQPPMSEWLDNHVVHFTQRWRYPAELYPLTGERGLIERSEYWYRMHMAAWGQTPRGIFGADERIRPGKVDPRQGCETCGMTEFSKSFYILGRITGDALYADRTEDVMLNHFPAAQTADLKGLRYLTASNMPQSDASEKHDFMNKGRQLVYSPHVHRCCQHNVAMGWPSYVQNLWQATADDGLAAWMYAASEVTAKVGKEGREVTIRAETDYPFSGEVKLSVSSSQPVVFPLYLRIPRWCREFAVTVGTDRATLADRGGEYVRIAREWATGDSALVEMRMDVALTRWPRNGSVTVDRGPLSYSVEINEDWRRCGGTDEWPEWEALPTSPWNYGLVVDVDDPARAFEVVEKGGAGPEPWTVEGAPVAIRAKAKRIPDWGLTDETVDPVREGPIRSDEPVETITMVPLGCARLRMSCLPVIGEGPDARRRKDIPAPGE
ncbi:MAG: beta-L-arabinofuranosidase domain-containing protein [Planctomycetota bacterium]